jgi:hypothetical protein
MLRLTLLLMLCLASLMDITIAHIVLVYERTTLFLYALVTAHVLIVVIVSHVGSVFLQEGLTLFESKHLDGPCFSCHGSRPTGSSDELLKTVKTSSDRMDK